MGLSAQLVELVVYVHDLYLQQHNVRLDRRTGTATTRAVQ